MKVKELWAVIVKGRIVKSYKTKAWAQKAAQAYQAQGIKAYVIVFQQPYL